ncbi:uncharacterized protein LOC111074694 [Drosophila obscura]|nr:uncharacterized protein LOC111074694 [Drosophila obscura]XP_022223273.1 uncharacterized protein LOC111074694 [Drosophila obscura]
MPKKVLATHFALDGERPSRTLILFMFAMAIVMKVGIIVVELMI